MLIFSASRLAYLATPKTGTTAVEIALAPRADIIFGKRRKHMTAQHFKAKIAPFLIHTFGVEAETVAVMREPVDQLRSWYKYRARPAISGRPRSTEGLSFDDFVMAVTSEAPPDFADIGSQFRFLTNVKGVLQIDHLFAYENQPAFLDFLSDRLSGNIKLQKTNVSPIVDAPISEAVEESFRSARREEFMLYDRLVAAGGYLKNA